MRHVAWARKKNWSTTMAIDLNTASGWSTGVAPAWRPGDLLVAFHGTDQSANLGSAPAGMTQIIGATNIGHGRVGQYRLDYRFLQAGDTTFTQGLTNGSAVDWEAHWHLIRGVRAVGSVSDTLHYSSSVTMGPVAQPRLGSPVLCFFLTESNFDSYPASIGAGWVDFPSHARQWDVNISSYFHPGGWDRANLTIPAWNFSVWGGGGSGDGGRRVALTLDAGEVAGGQPPGIREGVAF